MPDVALKGADKAVRHLKRAKGELREKAWKALRQGGDMVRNEAQARAPVFPSKAKRSSRSDVQPGALAASIKAKRSKKKLQVRVEADYPFGKKDGRYYAFAIEYGTRFQEAQPFLHPAAEAKENAIANALLDAMEEAIK
jgi:HK97 gp10 family phage protein